MYNIVMIHKENNQKVFQVKKRYRDFINLHEGIQEELKISCQELPKKLYFSDE